jgi:hypothetical protein
MAPKRQSSYTPSQAISQTVACPPPDQPNPIDQNRLLHSYELSFRLRLLSVKALASSARQIGRASGISAEISGQSASSPSQRPWSNAARQNGGNSKSAREECQQSDNHCILPRRQDYPIIQRLHCDELHRRRTFLLNPPRDTPAPTSTGCKGVCPGALWIALATQMFTSGLPGVTAAHDGQKCRSDGQ